MGGFINHQSATLTIIIHWDIYIYIYIPKSTLLFHLGAASRSFSLKRQERFGSFRPFVSQAFPGRFVKRAAINLHSFGEIHVEVDAGFGILECQNSIVGSGFQMLFRMTISANHAP